MGRGAPFARTVMLTEVPAAPTCAGRTSLPMFGPATRGMSARAHPDAALIASVLPDAHAAAATLVPPAARIALDRPGLGVP